MLTVGGETPSAPRSTRSAPKPPRPAPEQTPTPEEERPPSLDPMVMEEILSELRDIAARGGAEE